MKVSIIILSYNTSSLLKQTLTSIPRSKDYELIVVDNASTDDSVQMVKKQFPKVKIIENSKNLGFAAANNQGILKSTGKYIMLLNSDTEVQKDAIEKLINYLKTHPQVGAITPRVTLPDGSLDLACHRGMPTPWNAFCYFSGLEKIFPRTKLFAGYHQTYKDLTKTHSIDATAATAMILPREVIKQVGLLDEQFFLYAEDLDWCKRITDAGYKIIFYPHVEVIHHKSQSGKKSKSGKVARDFAHIHFYDTMKQFYLKHYYDQYPRWLMWLIFAFIDLKKKLKLRS